MGNTAYVSPDQEELASYLLVFPNFATDQNSTFVQEIRAWFDIFITLSSVYVITFTNT